MSDVCWCGADWLPHLGPPEDCQLRHDPVMVGGVLKEFYCGARCDQHQLSEQVHTFVRRVCVDGHLDNFIAAPVTDGGTTP